MIEVFPSAREIDDPATEIATEARPSTEGPWVYTNMITSADGATAVDGVSGSLGAAGDRAVFAGLRSLADAIIVGASTVRAEDYQAPPVSEPNQTARSERGQAPRPAMAIISNSVSFDPSQRLFGDPSYRPIVFTSSATIDGLATDRRAILDRLVDLIAAGDETVSLAACLKHLETSGARRVLCEGGPSLNGQFIAAGLIDEWNLTIAPSLASGMAKRAAVGPLPGGPPAAMTLRRVWHEESYLFCRWTRSSEQAARV